MIGPTIIVVVVFEIALDHPGDRLLCGEKKLSSQPERPSDSKKVAPRGSRRSQSLVQCLGAEESQEASGMTQALNSPQVKDALSILRSIYNAGRPLVDNVMFIHFVYLGWGHQREQRPQHRDNAASSEGLSVRFSSGTRCKSMIARVCVYG